jgi:VanZ family protein
MQASRAVAWALAALIVVLSLVPAALRPQTGAPHGVEHFAIFAATGMAFGLGYERRHSLIAVLLVLFAAAVECAQLAVPGRHARLSDFIVDSLALCVGLFAVSISARARVRVSG